jgi:hypothetical protein
VPPDDWSDPENICGRYILDADGNPVPEPDLFKWGLWLEENHFNRRVAHTELQPGVYVSTVFLAIDHGYGGLYGDPEPVLFETMCFDDYGEMNNDRYTLFDRYATREEALHGHEVIVANLRALLAERVK